MMLIPLMLYVILLTDRQTQKMFKIDTKKDRRNLYQIKGNYVLS